MSDPMLTADLRVHGMVAPGYEAVADAFARTLEESLGAGQACTVIHRGATVVDLWGGRTPAGTEWSRDLRAPVFSVSKGITALCLLMAADRGLLDMDAPVATIWPEFGQHGKERVTVRDALAHRAGVPALSWPATLEELAAWDPVVVDIAAAVPLWQPGSQHLYHALTVGFLAGEVLRRATGRRPSQWLAEEIAASRGLALTFTPDLPSTDIAALFPLQAEEDPGIPLAPELRELLDRVLLKDGAYGPDLFSAAGSASFSPESPAANLIASARDLAAVYSAAVEPGPGRLLSPDAVAAASVPRSWGEPFYGPDRGDIWGTGFMLHSGKRRMVGPGSFGHDGAGGQLAFAHPGHRLGFGYQTLRPGGDDDPRAEDLCTALRTCL